MTSLRSTEEPHPSRHAALACRLMMTVVAMSWLVLLPPPTFGQVDTTDVARPDTTVRPPPDSLRGRSQQAQESLRPLSFAPFSYGHAVTDSIPGRLPHVSVEQILGETPSSFLYDLGPAGWPHGWSHRGLAPHRAHLWLDGLPFDDPLTGRPRFELLPPSFLEPPRVGLDPGGGGVGVHTSWRDYAPKHPVTELRYRRDSNGLHAIEAAHSQKRRLDLFGPPGVLHLTFGYGGRKANGVYSGSALRRERRIWGRLRYQTNEWAVELSDRSSRYRVGAHGGVRPPGARFASIYALPVAATSVDNPRARRLTFRNDLVGRVRGPLVPGFKQPTELAASWTSNTFDFQTDFATSDTTWTARLNGAHTYVHQAMSVGGHNLIANLRASLWGVGQTNVPELDGSREEIHLLLRDSLRLGSSDLVLDLGGHRASDRWYPSAGVQIDRDAPGLALSASVELSGQRTSWIEEDGFAGLVEPLPAGTPTASNRLVQGTVGVGTNPGPFDFRLQGFAHQIQNAVDLYASVRDDRGRRMPTADTVLARRTEEPVRRAGATLSLGWRRDARRGLYATGHGTILQLLNANATSRHVRLARTLPTVFGQLRVGARFVIFEDLITDLYVRGRAWSVMNSRWFHPATGRLAVPPRQNPIPAAPGRRIGPSGTIDVRAEAQLRGATLFFTYENVQANTGLQNGTFLVPVYPLPAQQFRFGVFWPIFN